MVVKKTQQTKKKSRVDWKIVWFKTVLHLSALMPLLYAYYVAIFTSDVGDPVEYILQFTGIGALNVLLVTLLLSPLSRRLKWPALLKVRRLVGLYVFFYALCHVLSFFAFELQFDFSLFINEIVKRPYIIVGSIALLILLSLAITSLNSIRRKMGKQWQTLHNAVYLVALLAVWHFYWSVKSDVSSPLIYAVLVAVLLSFRFKKLQRIFQR